MTAGPSQGPSMKQLGILLLRMGTLLPLDGMLVHRRSTPLPPPIPTVLWDQITWMESKILSMHTTRGIDRISNNDLLHTQMYQKQTDHLNKKCYLRVWLPTFAVAEAASPAAAPQVLSAAAGRKPVVAAAAAAAVAVGQTSFQAAVPADTAVVAVAVAVAASAAESSCAMPFGQEV